MFSKPSVSLFLIIAICLAFILVVHLIEAWLLTELGPNVLIYLLRG
jgi:hypothetical protein